MRELTPGSILGPFGREKGEEDDGNGEDDDDDNDGDVGYDDCDNDGDTVLPWLTRDYGLIRDCSLSDGTISILKWETDHHENLNQVLKNNFDWKTCIFYALHNTSFEFE